MFYQPQTIFTRLRLIIYFKGKKGRSMQHVGGTKLTVQGVQEGRAS